MAGVRGPSQTVSFLDKDYETTILQWMDEEENNCNENSDEDSCDEDLAKESSHESDSEVSDTDNENYESKDEHSDESEDELTSNRKSFYGRNRMKWSSEVFTKRTRTPKHNIVVKLPILKPSAQIGSKPDPISVWKLLFSKNIIDEIVLRTNEKLTRYRQNYKDKSKTDLRDTDTTELEAFFGLLLFTAAFNSNHENIKRLFATDGTGRDIFRCVINQKRFAVLLVCLRFDDQCTRDERKKNDPTAPISQIFQTFINNCQSLYSLGTSACIDEMLVGFRGRCKFKMYLPNKPVKYGLKIMCLTDARNHYLYNAYIYCGKNSDGQGLDNEYKNHSKPTQAVMRLSEPLFHTNRNITADNWFGSIELVNLLKTKGLTFVGTLRKNKKEIPPEFLPNRRREIGSSIFGFTKDMTLVSNVTRKGKAVVLISSMHHDKNIDPENNKPEIISYYNLTKGGVDAMDEKCAKHSSCRRTCRWHMSIFFRMLDISAVNSHILYQLYKDNSALEKCDFIVCLAKQLVTPEMQRRVQNVRLNRELRFSIRRVLGLPEKDEHHEVIEERLQSRKTCYFCSSQKKRKAGHLCLMCKRAACAKCTKKICVGCSSNL